MKFEKDKMYILTYHYTKTLDVDYLERECWTIHPELDIKHWLIDDDDVIEGFVIIKKHNGL